MLVSSEPPCGIRCCKNGFNTKDDYPVVPLKRLPSNRSSTYIAQVSCAAQRSTVTFDASNPVSTHEYVCTQYILSRSHLTCRTLRENPDGTDAPACYRKRPCEPDAPVEGISGKRSVSRLCSGAGFDAPNECLVS